MKKIKSTLLLLVVLFSCSEESYIPKPSTYLRLTYPERNYVNYKDTCDFSFTIPDYFEVENKVRSCNKDINFKGLNGTLYLSYMPMDTSLSAYVNFSYSKVEEHKTKATAIVDTNILNPENGVYGTYFLLKGNVAKPIQFYLTDSTDMFMNGYVMFNTVPNYDSLAPIIHFVGDDIKKLMQTTQF